MPYSHLTIELLRKQIWRLNDLKNVLVDYSHRSSDLTPCGDISQVDADIPTAEQ